MKPLDTSEDRLAALLERCGLARAQARVLAALARGGGATAPELAGATGLSRQQAGEAAGALADAGLAHVETVATGGRPSKRYHVARPAPAERSASGAGPWRALVAGRRAALAQESAALDELEARFG